jgi:predicted nuclease of predicted toxin-antitoxin system
VADLEFLADMNISPLTVEQLRQQGLNVIRVSEIMKSNSKDKEVLAYARDNNKVLITQDLDFSMLLAVGGYTKPSVINLRLEKVDPPLPLCIKI